VLTSSTVSNQSGNAANRLLCFHACKDPVGLTEESTKCIAWNGRILVIGFAGGEIPKIAVNRALLKNCSIVGFMWGGYQANEREVIPGVFADLLKLFAEGKLKPIVYQPTVVGLENAYQALEAVANRKTYGKAVVKPWPPASNTISSKL